ncbi:hypothetical protein DPMN_074047 [Dreissena polymorpha]|uniref:RNB domain-containing protein n=1 Tax=Dreissena polymorpha TaxID=45954 RepID=A0A9D4BL76_DREPO|nr:hypothetical protein DPMN_074047 [Dreissena polymorpha]
MQEFLTKNDIYVDVVTHLQDKCLGGKVRGLHTLLSMERDALEGKYVVVPKQVRQRITDPTVSPKQVLTCDHLFPIQYVVNMHWVCIQEMAGYVCCTGKTSDSTDGKHYDLDVFPYVHFTSPIRRYIDLVVHRLLWAYLHQKPCPYKRHEIHSLCIDLSSKHKRAHEYRRNCILLKKALELQKYQQMIPCFVEDVSTSGITFCNPALNNVMRKDRTLEFNLLEMGHKPELMQGTSGQYINATWRKRLYDSKGMAFQYLKGSGKVDCLRLNSNKNAVLIPICTWAHMLKSAINDHNADFQRHLHAFQHRSPDFPGYDDVSTESIELKELKPCTKFSVEFRRGQVITIQMSAGPLRGIMVPKPVCLKLTDTISFCLLHTEDPVLHLSNYSNQAVSKSFRNATQYVNEWLPLILMESAANIVGCSNDNVSINNVNINFTSGTTGKFVLSIQHCEERNIELSGIQRDESDKDEALIKQSCDWLCLKVPLQRGTATTHDVNYNYWIGHGVITDIKQKGAQSDKLLVNFKLCARAGSFPSAIGNGNAKCSVEILKKSYVDW